jgi:hypothetical protein
MTEKQRSVDHPEITDARERDILGLDPLPVETSPTPMPAAAAVQPVPDDLPLEPEEPDEPEADPGGKPLSPRELIFLEKYVSGKFTASAAYAEAFPGALSESSQRGGAHRLLRRPRIAAELARLRAEARAELHYDLVELTRELDEKIAGAEKAGQWSAVANILALKAKAHALLIDRAEVKTSAFSLIFEGMPVPVGDARPINPALPDTSEAADAEVLPPSAAKPDEGNS